MRLVAAILLLATACSGGAERPPKADAVELVAQVASYDLAVGPPSRFMAGLLTSDNKFVSFGEVKMAFSFMGAGQSAPVPGPGADAKFMLIPGDHAEHSGSEPVVGPASQGRGVYAAQVAFDKPGVWQVEVAAEIDGKTTSGTAAFEVLERHQVPAVGDPAIPSENLTVSSVDAPPAAVDSRAGTEGKIPDEQLHQTTIKSAIERKRPALVVFATPVFCVSRFCGPVTDMVEELHGQYGDRAEFIHVEIWRDFQAKAINKAAADWIFRGDDLNEPWVFLIGADGKIAARWDNIATREEIEPLLRDLPPTPA